MSFAMRNIFAPMAALVISFVFTLFFWWAYMFAPFALLFAVMVLLYLRVSKASAAACMLGMGCAAALWFSQSFVPMLYVVLLFMPGIICAAETLKRGLRLSECIFITSTGILCGFLAALGLMHLVNGSVANGIGNMMDSTYDLIKMFYPSFEEDTLATYNSMFKSLNIEPFTSFEACANYFLEGLMMDLPRAVISFSAVGGVVAVTVPRMVLLRSGRDDSFARFTPIQRWKLPRNVMMGTAALFVLAIVAMFTGMTASYTLYNTISALLVAVYGVMGAVMLDRWLYRTSLAPGLRMSILLLLFLTLRFPLSVIGMFETANQLAARRRKEREEDQE